MERSAEKVKRGVAHPGDTSQRWNLVDYFDRGWFFLSSLNLLLWTKRCLHPLLYKLSQRDGRLRVVEIFSKVASVKFLKDFCLFHIFSSLNCPVPPLQCKHWDSLAILNRFWSQEDEKGKEPFGKPAMLRMGSWKFQCNTHIKLIYLNLICSVPWFR